MSSALRFVIRFVFSLMVFFSAALAHSEEAQSIHFAGFVSHFKSQPETHNGNMSLIGYSREYRIDNWQLEPGVSTFVDSYWLRSYSAFIDISNQRYAYLYFRPLLSVSCMYKGVRYGSDEREWACYPFAKFRFGESTGLFANFTPIPRVSGVTNGFVALELGYKW